MNCYLVTLDHPRSLLCDRKFVLKFHVNRITSFRDMDIWTFCKFGWKCLFPPPNLCFLGGFDPKRYFSSSRPQKAHPWANPRRLRYTSWKSVHPFLPRDATQSAVMRLHVVRLSVCLSVPLSVCNDQVAWSHTVRVKKYPPWGFLTFFPKRLGIFNNF